LPKVKETLASIAARDRAALAPYQKLEEVNTRAVMEGFFADPMAPIQEMIELRRTLTPEHYRAEEWTARYGHGDEAKIAAISFPNRLWQYYVAGTMLSEVLIAIRSGGEGEERDALLAKLVERRIKLMCGFFTAYRHAMQTFGEGDPEKALHFLTASAYRQLRHFTSRQTAPGTRTEDEMPAEVALFVAEAGLTPSSVAEMHTCVASSLRKFLAPPATPAGISVTLESDLPETGSLTLGNLEGGPSPEQELLAKDEIERWHDLIGKLPEKERLTMQLQLEEHSRQEIAASRGVSEETIKTQLERARAKLRLQEEDAA